MATVIRLFLLHHVVIILAPRGNHHIWYFIPVSTPNPEPVRFLKACPLSMGRLLSRVINRGILSCTFPDLKLAVVTPVQKSSSGSAINNFQPISVLPVFSTFHSYVLSYTINWFHISYSMISSYRISIWLSSMSFYPGPGCSLCQLWYSVGQVGSLWCCALVGDAHAWFESYCVIANMS